MANLQVFNKSVATVLLAFAMLTPLQASEFEKLFGQWGTETQCARDLITPKGTKYAEPFQLSEQWLGHGEVWCQLTWLGADSTPSGMLAFAQAQCGEDSVRDYQMRITLDDDSLTLVWNVFHKNGPLKRCDL